MNLNKSGKLSIHTRISPELYKAIKIRAIRNNTKVFEEIEKAISKYLKEEK